MAILVYSLCGILSLACAVLLLLSFRRSGGRLLLWTGLCFLGLAVNNLLLFVDFIIVPETDLFFVRTIPVLGGLAAMIYGLIWESV